MKKIKFYLIALAGGLFLTFNSCDSDDLTISQDEELMSLQLEETINKLKSAKEIYTSAAGHGIFIGDGYKRQFTFHANTMPDGSVEGNGVLIRTDGLLNVKFSIDCMIIDGNTATMSGYETKDKEPEYIGGHIWFKVVDNGEGNNSNPDEMSFMYWWPSDSSNDVDCNSYDDDEIYAIDSGNIQVK